MPFEQVFATDDYHRRLYLIDFYHKRTARILVYIGATLAIVALIALVTISICQRKTIERLIKERRDQAIEEEPTTIDLE